MNNLMKPVFIACLLLSLTACVTDQKMKVQFEPTLPVPFLVVPDEGTNNIPNNNSPQYSPPSQYAPPPQYKDYRRDNNGREDQGQRQYEDNEYRGYGY